MPLSLDNPNWRQAHLGYWLARSAQRFDSRVLTLMARNDHMPLALANLAARGRLTAAHVHITQHLAIEGARLTDLAELAGVSKQGMGKLVDQCAAWGLVGRQSDPRDARATLIRFTPDGLHWLQAYKEAVAQAQAELAEAIGSEIATVIELGLEAYAA